jgi:hypothetical protein
VEVPNPGLEFSYAKSYLEIHVGQYPSVSTPEAILEAEIAGYSEIALKKEGFPCSCGTRF